MFLATEFKEYWKNVLSGQQDEDDIIFENQHVVRDWTDTTMSVSLTVLAITVTTAAM